MALTTTYHYKCDKCGREPKVDYNYDSKAYGWGLLSIQQVDSTGMGHNGFFREKLLCNECRENLLKFLNNVRFEEDSNLD
jgi:hypothetical protein